MTKMEVEIEVELERHQEVSLSAVKVSLEHSSQEDFLWEV